MTCVKAREKYYNQTLTKVKTDTERKGFFMKHTHTKYRISKKPKHTTTTNTPAYTKHHTSKKQKQQHHHQHPSTSTHINK
jgi:hypothetical protein